MILADRGIDRAALPLAAIIEGLAATMRDELGDLVAVLRVVLGEPLASSPGAPSEAPGLIHVRADDLSGSLHRGLREFSRDWGLAFDHVLIDSSEIDPDQQAALWSALVDLPCPICVDYIFDQPEVWTSLAARAGAIGVRPVVLLGPLPEARLVRSLLAELGEIASADAPARAAREWIVDGLVEDRTQSVLAQLVAVLSQMYGSAEHIPPPWPIDAVRLRFEDDAGNRESLQRWARAITRRRVGLALGGAGAQSYAAIPFVEKLLAAGVPIDIMSGASTGAFLAVLFAALGERGMLRFLRGADAFGWGVFFALFHNLPLTWWLAWATNFVDLADLAQPTLTVASRADDGQTHVMSSGLAAKMLMASGSMAPFVATYVGNRRLLDGGVTCDLPTAQLLEAGANMVIAVQAVPKLMALPHLPESVSLPAPIKFAILRNPLVRVLDSYRAFLMLVRQSAVGHLQHADVIYEPSTRWSSAGTWFAGPRIARDAARSPELAEAVAAAKARWDELRRGSPRRVRINGSGHVEVGPAVELGFVFDRGLGQWRLTGDADALVYEVGRHADAHARALRVALLDPPADLDRTHAYERLIRTAAGLGSERVEFTSARWRSSPGPTSFELAVVD
jgi:predicted acylesterase/phospholipase RssA